MELTKESQELMQLFIKNHCINHSAQTKRTDSILTKIFYEMQEAYAYIEDQKKQQGMSFFKLSIKDLSINGAAIPKPKSFNVNTFPKEVREHIDTAIMKEVSYTFSLFERSIRVCFFVEDMNVELHLERYNDYVEKILVWLYIVNEYASKQCSKKITIYLYFTSMRKGLPTSNIDVLDEININTAFTYTCPVDSEIVIFRKEEWFKVLIHETFHNFGLDFSDMNMEQVNTHIKRLYDVESDINLYESYTEFWARIMNSVFCSFFATKTISKLEDFLTNTEFFINFERTYGFFQLAKVLDFMGLSYKDMYSKTEKSKTLRTTLYKERTNVLSYYIITMVLMNNYQLFLSWCNKNNLQLLQFKKSAKNLEEFCTFIERHYKSKSMTDGIICTDTILDKFKRSKKKSPKQQFILNNMRMSICEMG